MLSRDLRRCTYLVFIYLLLPLLYIDSKDRKAVYGGCITRFKVYSQILREIEHLHDLDSLTHSMVTLTSHQNTVLLLFKLRLRTSNPRPRLGQGVARAAATLLYGVTLPPPRACAAPRQTWNGCAVSCARTPRPRGLSNRRRPSRRPTRLGAKSRDVTGMPLLPMAGMQGVRCAHGAPALAGSRCPVGRPCHAWWRVCDSRHTWGPSYGRSSHPSAGG